MSPTKTDRACMACGGIGWVQAPDIIRDTDGHVYSQALCPVCAGKRRISDRMPAADALADAETLRRVWTRRVRARTLVGRAAERGLDVVRMRPWLGDEAVSLAGRFATEAARAAFRAVPGLRG